MLVDAVLSEQPVHVNPGYLPHPLRAGDPCSSMAWFHCGSVMMTIDAAWIIEADTVGLDLSDEDRW